MEFYQKLQALRKEAGMSQEDLADQLNVSRQAVSKWENGQGYPETDKLVQISILYNVSLDYLLKEDAPSSSTQDTEPGYYASRETVNGFLAFKRKGALRVASGVAILILSLIFPCTISSPQGTFLFFIGVALAIGLFVSLSFRNQLYKEVETQPLLFDNAFIKEFRAQYAIRRKKYGILLTCGIVTILLGVAVSSFLSDKPNYIQDSNPLFFVFVAAGVFMIILASSAILNGGIIAQNDKHIAETQEDKAYGWVYAIIMPLAAMAFLAMGFLWQAWHPGWLVFPSSSLLGFAIVSILKYRHKS